MGRPKKKRQPTEFEIALNEAKSDSTLTVAEREALMSGEAAAALYRQETGEKLEFRDQSFSSQDTAPRGGYLPRDPDNPYSAGRRLVQKRPEAFVGDSGLALQNSYFVKAYQKIKKEQASKKDKIKLLTDQPGLNAQTRGQSALSLAQGAPSTALSAKAKY